MQWNFKDKVVVVTGGSRGIGRSTAAAFARAGAHTIITYASSSVAAEEFVSSHKAEGLSASCYGVDVRDPDSMAEFIATVAKEYGQIDVLVNNAGIIRDTLIMMMDKNDWQDVINTNLTGVYNAIKPVSKLMMRKKSGAIINLSSIVASKPGRGQANYAATKGGVESLTRAIAAELGSKGIRVNAVAPGMIETEMTQVVRDAAGDEILKNIAMRRFGKPEDIANAVMFLASDAASYITGEVLHVDGGL